MALGVPRCLALATIAVGVLSSLLVSASAAPEHAFYTAQFWNLAQYAGDAPPHIPTGPAALVRSDARIDFDWGLGSPAPGVGKDFFAARWTKSQRLRGGTYQFTVGADDGVRLYVDGTPIVDEWKRQSFSTHTADVVLARGEHVIQMDYYEQVFGAAARMSFKRIANSDVPPSTTAVPVFTLGALDLPPPAPTSTMTTTTTALRLPPTTLETPKKAATQPSRVLFEDNFDGGKGALPDASKWGDYSTCTNGGFASWGMIRCGNDETLDGDGHLALTATPSYGSGLQTRDKFGFTYGTASVWIKMPATHGYWPGWWTLNGTQTGSQTAVNEIDITEVYTSWPGSNSTFHAWNGGTNVWNADNFLCANNVDLSADFHKYSARVEPGKVTFYFDDQQCGTPVVSPTPEVMRDNWLILDLAVGGAGQAPPTNNASMLVDRVEVLAL